LIIGGGETAPGEFGAIVWHRGQSAPLASETTEAWGINDRGQIVGAYGGPEGTGSFLWQHGKITKFGQESSVAYGLNDRGQIVGSYLSVSNPDTFEWVSSAYFWSKGHLLALPVPDGSYGSYAQSINNKGQIVGQVVGQDWFPTPVIWTSAGQKENSK
jgi:uncharacterized membrane protein